MRRVTWPFVLLALAAVPGVAEASCAAGGYATGEPCTTAGVTYEGCCEGSGPGSGARTVRSASRAVRPTRRTTAACRRRRADAATTT